ncbi:metallophosphoesterase [Salipaludibacillus daqingensis]|uniref:metallophosphoesterase n=1 Tax=Salipaludibacillus daqingensis TaxID=3041001 RepID=UPI002476A695|nr:metallophosphoesterase [Salipaludibacillus daqingensis]
MNAKVIASFGLFIVVYSSLNFYIGWNIHVWFQTAFQISNPILLGFIITFLAFSYLVGQFIKPFRTLKMVGSIWFGCFQFGLVVLPLANIFIFILHLLNVSLELGIIIVGLITWVLFFIYIGFGLYNAYQPIVRTYSFKVPRGKSKRKSLRIAVASDMHFGGLSGKNHAKRLVKTINKLNAELVLFPGDLVDDDPGIFREKRMDRTLKKINSELGVYGVLGNHEYYGGKIKELTKIMKNIQVHILQDESVVLDNSIKIIGRKDKTDRHRKSMGQWSETEDSELPTLVLDHQPLELNQIRDQGADIVICGHTHRGQIAPNHWITKKLFELDWGYKQKDQLHVIVSSGFGFWGPPIRLGSRSEVIQLNVTFTDS